MALATRCPHCGTSFRVAQDQLKLRAGLVRCGACKEIFNGAENLISLETAQRTASPASATASAASGATANSAAAAATAAGLAAPVTPGASAQLTNGINRAVFGADNGSAAPSTTGPNPAAPPAAVPEPAKPDAFPPASGDSRLSRGAPAALHPQQENVLATAKAFKAGAAHEHSLARQDMAGYRDPDTRPDPLTRMTLMDFAGTGLVMPSKAAAHDQVEGATHDDVGQAIDELKRKPWRRLPRGRAAEAGANDETDAIDAIDEAGVEPEFLQQARRQEHFARRFGAAMAVGSGVLAIALLLQGAYAFRNPLAAMLPQTRPALLVLCKVASCRIDLPAQIDAVSIETNEMQAVADNPDGLQLTALLRNRSTLPQAWPSIELTLNDPNDKPLARRVFGPREYLGADLSNGNGFPANSEQGIRLMLSLNQLKPAGYRLYLFYP
jgi:predicted Zn finger-like uncharacterized protein